MTANVIITKSFSTPKGTLITVTGTLQLEKEVYLDGPRFTVDCCEIYINVYAQGHGDQGGNLRKLNAKELKAYPGYSHVCGMLVFTTEQAELIASIRAELEQHPTWQAKQARIAANEKSEAEERKARNSHPGWCNKCQSYCYGDCTAN